MSKSNRRVVQHEDPVDAGEVAFPWVEVGVGCERPRVWRRRVKVVIDEGRACFDDAKLVRSENGDEKKRKGHFPRRRAADLGEC